MKSFEVRNKFLSFFKSKDHTIVPSSSLVPKNDPSLLFTNSGMVQFKEIFLGVEKKDFIRAASVQKCIRAGGKHNDLENVGYTARHHTFFEMLGNWSFGDYFKKDSLKWSFELLTEVFMLPKNKLWVTVYKDDEESYDIWVSEIGVPSDRVIRMGDKKGKSYTSDNFWQMAETGPCGPCSEIFYDHGHEVWGGPPGSDKEEGDRFIEVWNNVFMQFDRQIDKKTGEVYFKKLPVPCVDTGLGLERLVAILQSVNSNYEIDLFDALIKASSEVTDTNDLSNDSLKVIADHIRASSFLIIDGVIPGNEGRSYVLRRIIRRALRHGNKLGKKTPFFHKLVSKLADEMGDFYTELREKKKIVTEILKQEEERFNETLEKGMKILEQALGKKTKVLKGEDAFILYDTYGFPLDLTADICRERNITLDEDGFNNEMEKQKNRARKSGNFESFNVFENTTFNTIFLGYEKFSCSAKVVEIFYENKSVDFLDPGQKGVVILDTSPFYAESGGQIGDIGFLENQSSFFVVQNSKKIKSNSIAHIGYMKKGKLKVSSKINGKVDKFFREAITRNHSATHLLHWALRSILGDHVEQKGSLVSDEKLRFDFSHTSALSDEQLIQLENLVNDEIMKNSNSEINVMSITEAEKIGALALFGEKYDKNVRVLKIGPSLELCGGTHVHKTGDIGVFKIIFEGGIASGVRRIEAITGKKTLEYFQTLYQDVNKISFKLKISPNEILSRIESLLEQIKKYENKVSLLQDSVAISKRNNLLSLVNEVKGVKVLSAILDNDNASTLRDIADKIKSKFDKSVIVLASSSNQKIVIISSVTKNIVDKINAVELINFVAKQVDGKGGGRADMAQGGGSNVKKLSNAIDSVNNWIENRID